MGRRTNNLLLAAALAALVLIAYVPAMRGGFFWDDDLSLTDNPLVKADGGLRRIWFTRDALDYFPLTSSMMWVEWRVWDERPAGYHVVNILLHAAAAVLVWRVLRRLNVPGAWLAGALFGLHPVAAESAAWITEGKNTLSMLLYLLALLAWLTYDENEKRRWYVAALALFLLALLAKTSVVMMPAVLLLCAWWRRGAVTRRDVARSLPFFAVSLALGLVTVWFQSHNAIGGAVVRPEGMDSRIAATGWIVWFYLWKALLPTGLCILYPRWTVDGHSVMAYLPLALLLAGLAVLWVNRARWGRAPLFALGYFLITLLPVLGLADMSFMKLSLVSDHLQYLALAAVPAFIAAALARAAADKKLKTAAVIAGAACVAAFAGLTWQRAALFTDGVRLWQDNVEKKPAVYWAWNNMGNIHLAAGRNEEALRCFSQALAAKPDYDTALGNRGKALVNLKRYPEALRDLNEAVALNPNFANAYNDRSDLYIATGRFQLAVDDCDRAIKLEPKNARPHNNRGLALAGMGRYDEAVRAYDQALALNRDLQEPYLNRALALAALGRDEPALSDYSRFIALKPQNAEAYRGRAVLYDKLNRRAEALQDLDKAIALAPDSPVARYSRALFYFEMKEYGKARADLEACEKLHGNVDPGFRKAVMQATGRTE